MKLAFLVIVHTDAEQVKNLVNRLSPNEFFDSKIFLHVDAKTDIAPFEKIAQKNYVQLTQKRINVVRCGISQVDAALELMHTVLQTQERFDRYVLITGQDYPVVSNRELAERLARDCEYMRAYKVTGSVMNNKVCRYYFYNKFLVGSKFKDLLRRSIQLCFRVFSKKDTIDIDGGTWAVYYSSAYFAVSHDLLCDLYEKGWNKKYYKYFKNAICSDEMFFVTIAANGQFRNKLEIIDNPSHTLLDNSSITYFDYQDRPVVLTEREYDKIVASGRMFARKFSSVDSSELINKLNEKG